MVEHLRHVQLDNMGLLFCCEVWGGLTVYCLLTESLNAVGMAQMEPVSFCVRAEALFRFFVA